jgi:hypothetical protein
MKVIQMIGFMENKKAFPVSIPERPFDAFFLPINQQTAIGLFRYGSATQQQQQQIEYNMA